MLYRLKLIFKSYNCLYNMHSAINFEARQYICLCYTQNIRYILETLPIKIVKNLN